MHDTDPPGGHPDDEVSEIETFDTLYAAWAPVPGATGYQVGVFTEVGTALEHPEYASVIGTTATVSNLPVILGGRYRFGVIAVGPGGTSPEAVSPGVTVVDRSPPQITVTADPPAFAPSAGQRSTLGVVTVDRTGLVHAHAEVRRMDGTTVRVIDDHDFHPSQPSRTVRYVWNGADAANNPLPPGLYVIAASATDVGGHSVTQMGSVSITLAPPDAGTTASGAGGDGGGCGCTTARSGHQDGALPVLFLATTGLAFRRRRRR